MGKEGDIETGESAGKRNRGRERDGYRVEDRRMNYYIGILYIPHFKQHISIISKFLMFDSKI